MSSVESEDAAAAARAARRFKVAKSNSRPKRTLFGSNLEIPDKSASSNVHSSQTLQAESRQSEKKPVTVPAEWDRKYLRPLQARLERSKAEYARLEQRFAGNAGSVVLLNELGQAAAGDPALMRHLWSLTEPAQMTDYFSRKGPTSAPAQAQRKHATCQVNEAELLNGELLRRKVSDESEENELNFFRKAALSTNLIQRQLDIEQPMTGYAADYHEWQSTNLQPERLYKNKLKPRNVVTVDPNDLPKNISQRSLDPKLLEWMHSEDFKRRVNEYEVSRRKPNDKAKMLERIRTEKLTIPPLAPCDQMGVILRSNLFPASLFKQPQMSVLKEAHNAEVFQHRDLSVPDSFRHQRDGNTKWTEENLIMERQRRLWEAYFADQKKSGTEAS